MSKDAGGGTASDLLKRAARRGDKRAIAALKVKKDPPAELAHVLLWYLELRRQAARGFRFEPIQFDQITHYRDLFALDMGPWEIDLLLEIDVIWQKAQPEPEKPGAGPGRHR